VKIKFFLKNQNQNQNTPFNAKNIRSNELTRNLEDPHLTFSTVILILIYFLKKCYMII